MPSTAQQKKAEKLLALHHAPELLVLPNIWNPLGARLLAGLGFPAVATASAAVAYAAGYDDGERIGFGEMLEAIRRIAAAVDLPLTADVESGYADGPDGVTENVRQVLRAGAVGVNLEDSPSEGRPLRPVDVQCDRIRAARRAGKLEGIPLVINARIDVFLCEGGGERSGKIAEAIERGRAYREAGADCLYPIGPGDLETLKPILEGTGAPINVYCHSGTAPMRELEAAGISRMSLGPNLLKAAFTAVRDAARDLQQYGSYDRFTKDAISTDEIRRYLFRD